MCDSKTSFLKIRLRLLFRPDFTSQLQPDPAPVRLETAECSSSSLQYLAGRNTLCSGGEAKGSRTLYGHKTVRHQHTSAPQNWCRSVRTLRARVRSVLYPKYPVPWHRSIGRPYGVIVHCCSGGLSCQITRRPPHLCRPAPDRLFVLTNMPSRFVFSSSNIRLYAAASLPRSLAPSSQ